MKEWWKTYHVDIIPRSLGGLPYRHVKVERIDGKDGITWDTLQAIKNDVLGPDVLAIEVFPPESRLVNELNMRHLWEVPNQEAFPFLL